MLAGVQEQAAASQLQQMEQSKGAAALRQEEHELRGQVQALEEQLSRAGYKPEVTLCILHRVSSFRFCGQRLCILAPFWHCRLASCFPLRQGCHCESLCLPYCQQCD